MQFDFKNKNLIELYTQGRNKKYNLPGSVIKKFFMRIEQIESAASIHDLWKTPSVNFEKMRGHDNQYSLRLDKGWRMEIGIQWNNNEKTEGDVTIPDITRHYGDSIWRPGTHLF